MLQRRNLDVTDEMVDLYEAGLQLVAAGHDDVDDDSAEPAEFRAISKALDWQQLKLPLHAVSVLDPALDGEMPGYMQHLASGQDWDLSQSSRKALMEAVDERRGT